MSAGKKQYALDKAYTDEILRKIDHLLDDVDYSGDYSDGVAVLKQQRDELLARIGNIYDCVSIADDKASDHGYEADGSIRRHLRYAMTIANIAKAGK